MIRVNIIIYLLWSENFSLSLSETKFLQILHWISPEVLLNTPKIQTLILTMNPDPESRILTPDPKFWTTILTLNPYSESWPWVITLIPDPELGLHPILDPILDLILDPTLDLTLDPTLDPTLALTLNLTLDLTFRSDYSSNPILFLWKGSTVPETCLSRTQSYKNNYANVKILELA